ncbi:MAG TPA: Fic family protein [Deltaproteobacteria bacterium]|nr:Fic family protein [Deltaproteobacteria bacterium]HPP79429.1 Fic family protein [Deltaproteobacteria bacterium]
MKRPGRTITLSKGGRAFVPDPLPPKLEWSHGLLRSLSEADRLLGWLAGEGRRMKNPTLLMRPFLTREAVLSSRIEGTQATLGEILAADAGAGGGLGRGDLREVANYVACLNHGIARLGQTPLSTPLVLELHERLMDGVRGEDATPGEFRKVQNWIGPPGCRIEEASYVPPPPELVPELMASLEAFLQDDSLPPLVQIGLAHYQFEAIHPFMDGNGRMGRLLVILFLIERGVLPTPLLYLSAFFEATRDTYYRCLRRVDTEGDWEGWLSYFFTGIARQAEDALDRAESINDIIASWRHSVAGLKSKILPLVIDALAANPFTTATRLAQGLGVAFTTAQRAIDHLVELGILVPTSHARRDRVYCAKGLLDVLERPARLRGPQ